MLSLPEDCDYSLAGLCAISKEEKDGIRSILKELVEHYYLEIAKARGDKVYFEYNYLIYETPNFVDLENKQTNPNMEIPTQINTNKINIKKQIDKDDKIQISSFCAKRT